MLKSLLLTTALILGGTSIGLADLDGTSIGLADQFPYPEFSQKYTPPPKKIVEIPLQKCSTDVNLLNSLIDNGYSILLQFQDMSRTEVYHSLLFSEVDRRLILVHTIAVSGDPEKIQKVCIEYMGNNPDLDGVTFKALVLSQHIQATQKELDDYQRGRKEHDKPHDPYQGDPNKM